MTLNELWEQVSQYKLSFAEAITFCKTYPHQLIWGYVGLSILIGIQLIRHDGAQYRKEKIADGLPIKDTPTEEIVLGYIVVLLTSLWLPFYFIYRTNGLGVLPLFKLVHSIVDLEGKRL